MNIKMIGPRSIFERKPLGKAILKEKHLSKNCDFQTKSLSKENEFSIVKSVSNQQMELYVSGCDAVLHNFAAQDSNHMLTGYTETPIKCASFARMSNKVSTNATYESIFQDLNELDPKGVVLFTETIAKYYGFDAEIHTCTLPCGVSSAWKFRECLFVEREELTKIVNDYSPHSLFVMLHCLAEFTPVVFRDEFGNCGFVNDTRFRIVAVCESSYLLLAYDTADNDGDGDSFSLWRIRDATQQDFSDLYDMHWDGSIAVKKQKLKSNSISGRSKMESSTNHMNPNDNSHISSDYFEISIDGIKNQPHVRTVEDLDIRSPIARSLKVTKDSQIPDKMALLQEINNCQRMNPSHRQMIEPLYPKVCLDFLFSCKPGPPEHTPDDSTVNVLHTISNGSNNRKLSRQPKNEKVTGFFAEDFYRRKYLCLLKSCDRSHFVLKIVKFNYENGSFSYLDEKSWSVLDAVYLERLQFTIVLELGSTLSIYSGMTFVCKISLLNALIYQPDDPFDEAGTEMPISDINSMIRLSDPTDCGFTIHTQSDLALRLYLPGMVRLHLVRKCLAVLKKLLPIDIGMVMLCRWYSLNRAVDNNESASAEWRRFVEFLLENMGFVRIRQTDKATGHDGQSIVRDVKELCLDNGNGNGAIDTADISMGEELEEANTNSKKLRTNSGLYSIERRSLNERDGLEDYSSLCHNVRDRLLSQHAPAVLFSLHLVYECEKLNYSFCRHFTNLAALNCSIACSIGANRYLDYYVRDNPDLVPDIARLPSLVEHINIAFDINTTTWNPQPPDWNRILTDIMTNNHPHDHPSQQQYPIVEDLNEMLTQLVKIWLVMFRPHISLQGNPATELNRYLYRINFNLSGIACRYPIHSDSQLCLDLQLSSRKGTLQIGDMYQRTATYLSEIKFHLNDLDFMNDGLASIFKLIFYRCNKYPELYSILQRADLDKQRQLILPIMRESAVPEVLQTPLNKFRSVSEARRNCHSYWANNVKPPLTVPKWFDACNRDDNNYLVFVLDSDPIVQLSYPDIRIHEAYKMLQSCCPIKLDVNICTNFTIEDGDTLSTQLKEELEGYLKIINCHRTFSLPIGRGMLGLQVVQSNWLTDKLPVPQLCLTGKFSLSESGKPQTIESNASTKIWPNFHNGVATGLMISPMNESIDIVWILKQCPSMHLDRIELSAEQAGVLFGLGLNGHLNKLSADTIGQAIKSMNEMATMAFLIGLSAFNIGSKNSLMSKHISFHYRRLIPGEKDQIDPIPTLCQVSAIIAAGLLNFKSGDRKMAKIFIEEMGRSREHLSVEGTPPMDVELTSVTAGFSVGLIMFQQGGALFNRESNPEELVRLMSYLKGSYRIQPKDGGCSVDIPNDLQIRAILKNNDMKKSQPISEADNWNAFQTKNPRVQEGEFYNTDITGSGAAVAIGLIYMDSMNGIIARHLECPETFYLLEQIRSPILCFRQIAHGLVMWRQIKPSLAWVEASIPEFVSSKAFVIKPTGIQEKYLDTVNESYLQMLVGSCFVMGLRYAGTDNDNARNTIVTYVEKLIYIKSNIELMPNVNRNHYDWALSTLFLSACMISAGSGNLTLLRISRYLQSIHHPKDCGNYGVFMTYSMSIGLLFLGGGKLTLSNSPRSAAILLIAFFPRFPPTYSGRRYHLQSLRHLYVIATRPRVMCAVDLDTQTAVPIESKITFKDHHTRHHSRCFVYPSENPNTIEQIELYDKNNEYWPQIYKPNTEPWKILYESFQSGGYFFVKKEKKEIIIKELFDKLLVDNRFYGYQLADCNLLEKFILQANDLEYLPDTLLNGRIIDFLAPRSHDLKRIFQWIRSADPFDVDDFNLFHSFILWCHENNLIRIWTVFSSLYDSSIDAIRSVQSGDFNANYLSADLKLVFEEILK